MYNNSYCLCTVEPGLPVKASMCIRCTLVYHSYFKFRKKMTSFTKRWSMLMKTEKSHRYIKTTQSPIS